MEFKPFDKVMCRDNKEDKWRVDFYARYDSSKEFPHYTLYSVYRYCKPYNEEEYLEQFGGIKTAAEYEKRQDKWVADNGVKPGSIVRVTRAVEDNERGWANNWSLYMSFVVGYLGEVMAIEGSDGIRIKFADKCDTYSYPYFVLEVVKP